MWSLKRDGEGSENEQPYYLIVGEHLVGRKDCQIQVAGDQSVSRKHAWITVSQSGTASVQVTLKDVSKFGCSVNGVKCQNSVAIILKHDDNITFGTQNSSYRLNYEPLVGFASCLENAKKKNLKSQLSKLGGYMVNEWQKECSHLVMDALSFTVKVIYALVTCCPIVTPSFFDDLNQAIDSKTELPSPEKYMPPIKEDLIDPKEVSFHPNEARKSVFAGKLFLFLEKKQHKRLEQAIALAGGKSLLKETGDISGSDDDMLTDQNTLVMSVDLKTGVSEAKEMWIGHVGDLLKSVNRRPIAETEVGLALLHMSLDEYCNSSVHRVPRITKQIVSKSISSMEEMSQRMNESQNVSTLQVPEKKPFSLRSDNLKPNTTVITADPQDNRKRSRNGSDDSQPLAFETPQSRNVESKRRKLSPTDITHVSQTPESQFKTPGVQQKTSPDQQQSTKKHSRATPKENRIADITHISQSEGYQIADQPSVCISETPSIGQKRKATSPSNNITHVSQSQVSQHEEKPSSPGGTKLRLSRSKADVTHITQTQLSQHEEKVCKTNAREITHISQSQNSPDEMKRCDTGITNNQRPKLNISDEEVTVIPDSQTSPIEVKVQETPSPEVTFTSKRRKITSPDLTHISDTERSMLAEPQRCSNSVSSPGGGQITLDDSVSPRVNNKSLIGSLDDRGLKNSSRKPNSKGDTKEGRGNTEKSSRDQGVDQEEPLSVKKNDSYRDDVLHIDKVVQERTPGIQDLTTIKSSVSPPRSGWMSKRSFSVKKEKSEIHQSENTANIDRGIEDLGETSSREGFEGGNTQKASQGFLSKLQQQTHSEEIVVKNEEKVDLPSDLMCVEHIELVVAKRVRPKTQQSQKKFSTTLKNMKQFRKQNYAGDDHGIPRIIGGSDLVLFSSRNGNLEDWMLEVQAMNEQDQEEREADNLFRYEPSTKRRKRR